MNQAVQQIALLLRLGHGFADDDQRAGQDFQVVAVAAERLHAAFDVGVEALRVGHRAAGGEHHFGGFGGDLPAGFRRAGLDDDRPALDGTGDVERAADREMGALVVQDVHAVRVEVDAVFDVADEGIVGPAVPQAGHDVVELARLAVAGAVLDMFLQAEIAGRPRGWRW